MRSRLLLFCLLAGCSATEQKADSQPLEASVPLTPLDILSPLTADQLTAYAVNSNQQIYGSKGTNLQSGTGYKVGDTYDGGVTNLQRGDTAYDRGVNGYTSEGKIYDSLSRSDGRWSENIGDSYRSDNKGLYAYGYDGGHKSARGYSDSLPKDYPYQLIGRHAIGFQNRYIRASGFMFPITPESLAPLGYRQKKKEIIFVPPY